MPKILYDRPIAIMVIVVLAMLLFGNETIPVSIMEARNFITAREMVDDGNWLLTTMNGEARYEKPPLPTWLTALSGLLFGMKSITALRLPAIIFIAIIGIYIFLLSKKLLGNTAHSICNALIGISSFYVIGIVFEAPWDIFAHGFMLMGIYYLTVLYYTDTNRLRFGLLAGLFMGCSFLSKGPIPMYALFLPFLISFGIIYRFKGFKRKWPILILAFVVAIMIGGWWFVYVRIMDPETFVSIAERETNNWHSYNTKPIYYYWSFFAQSGIWTIPAFIALLYPYLKKRVSNLKAYQFSLLWTVLAVVLLSLVPEKKSRYLMPVLIPMAINTGFYIEYLIRSFKELKEKKTLLPVHFNFGLIGIVALGAPVALFFLLGESLKKHWIGFAFSSLIMILIGVAIILFLKQKNFRNVFLLTVAFFVSTFMFVLPVLKNSVGKPISPLTITNHENLTVYGMDYVSPEIIWYYGDIIKPLKMADGSYSFPNEKQFGIIGSGLNEKDRHALQKRYHIEEKASFDLNPTIGSRHNDRLIGEFYILTEL